MKWSLDDVRIVGDIVAASLLARMVQLVALKAFIEPAGHFIGTSLPKRLRGLSGGRLPALPWVSADGVDDHGPALARGVAVGTAANRLDHPSLAEVEAGEAQPLAVGVESGAADQVGFAPGVVDSHMG